MLPRGRIRLHFSSKEKLLPKFHDTAEEKMGKRSALHRWGILKVSRIVAIACLLPSLGDKPIAQTPVPTKSVPRPPMGWNSWNSFANIVNSDIVQQQAKALAASGMKEVGYEYVVIDEGWWL